MSNLAEFDKLMNFYGLRFEDYSYVKTTPDSIQVRHIKTNKIVDLRR